MKKTLLAFVTLSIVSVGCGVQQEIEKVREDFKKQLEETRQVAKEAIRAVPGERYLQLVDDINSGEPGRVKRAQTFLRSLGHLEPEATYEVSVWFESTPTRTVTADIIRAKTNLRVDVEQYLKNSSFNPTVVTNPQTAALTREQVQADASRRIRDCIDDICGRPQGEITQVGNALSRPVQFPLLLSAPTVALGVSRDEVNAKADAHIAAIMKERDKVAAKLTDAVMLQFAETLSLVDEKRLHKPWSAFDDRQVLVVLLQKKEWNEFKANGGLRIRAVVHKKDDPSHTLDDSRIYTFKLSEFDPKVNEPFHGPRPDDDEIVWAAHNMSDFGLMTATALEQIKAARKIADQWDEEKKKGGR